MGLFGPPDVKKLEANRDVNGLVKLLTNKDAKVAGDAALALASLRDPRSVEPLALALLKNGERSTVMILIGYALEQIGPPSVEPLIAVLSTRTNGTNARIRAVEALGKIAIPPATEAVAMSALGAGDDAEVRGAAFSTLRKIGPRAVEGFASVLKSPTNPPDLRAQAVNVIAKMGGPGAIEALIWAQGDAEPKVRQAAYARLVEIGEPAVGPLVASLPYNPWAGLVLGRTGDPRAIEALAEMVYRGQPEERLAAALMLAGFGDRRAVTPLILIVQEKNGPTQARVQAISALGRFEDEGIAEHLVHAQSDPDIYVRLAASRELERLGAAAIEPLARALPTRPYSIWPEIVSLLDKLGWQPGQDEAGAAYWIVKREWARCRDVGAPAARPLVLALQDDDEGVKAEARGSLLALGEPAVEALATALQYQNPAIRNRAVEILGELKDPRAIEPLVALLDESDRTVTATRLLLAYGESVREPLLKAMQEPRILKRRQAAVILGKLGYWRGVDMLAGMLRNGDEKAKRDGAWGLGKIASSGAVQALAQALVLEPPVEPRISPHFFYDDVHADILRALQDAGDSAMLYLGLGLLSGSPLDCSAAYQALVELNVVSGSLDPVPEILRTPRYEDAAHAALVKAGLPAVEPLILRLSQDKFNEGLLRTAGRVIRTLGQPAIDFLIPLFQKNRQTRYPIILVMDFLGKRQVVLEEMHGVDVLTRSLRLEYEDEALDALMAFDRLGITPESEKDRELMNRVRSRSYERAAADRVAELNRRYGYSS